MTHSPHRTNKVGVLPWRVAAAEDGRRTVHYLIHQPLPIRGDSAPLPWGVARGTVQRAVKTGDAARDDVREIDALAAAAVEDPWQTAQREAQEELGIAPAEIIAASRCDHGLHDYVSQTAGRGSYPIRIFSFRIAALEAARLGRRAQAHSAAVGWRSLAEMRAMAAEGTFKPGYLPIVAAVEAALPRVSEAS